MNGGLLIIGMLVVHCISLGSEKKDNLTCSPGYKDHPIAKKDGDLIIGGIFNIGSPEINYHDTTDLCSYQSISQYSVQKAVVLRHLVEQTSPIFEREFNITLGYEMYTTCNSYNTATRVSVALSENPGLVGVASVDYKQFIKISATVLASFRVPTFVYMYNDEELMEGARFPTVYSLIDTESIEAEITIQFLRKMGLQFMDIWYHPYSRKMAEYVYQNFTLKVGCGRFTEVGKVDDVHNIADTYSSTGGEAADVQLILSNSYSTTKSMLDFMVNELGFRNKIYVLGISVAREKYLDSYASIFKSGMAENSTLILPQPKLLGADLKTFQKLLSERWSEKPKKDKIDEIYEIAQANCGPVSVSSCVVTSWVPYIVAGFKFLTESLFDNLKLYTSKEDICLGEFRESVYNTIINETRSILTELDVNFPITLVIKNKTIITGYKINVYQSHNGNYDTLGEVFPDTIKVTNQDLMEKISIYRTTCSPKCSPGHYTQFRDNLMHLPCCWDCSPCPDNFFSTGTNELSCKKCNSSQTSIEDRTACITVKDMYIPQDSQYFISGTFVASFGTFLTVIISVFIFLNKERPVIKASDTGYLSMVLASLFVSYPASIIPLFKPTESSCIAEYFTYNLFATLISVNLCFKCVKIYGIFAAAQNFDQPKFGKFLTRKGQIAFNILTIAINITLISLDCFVADGPSWGFAKIQSEPHEPFALLCCCHNLYYLLIPSVIPAAAFLLTLALAFKMKNFPHNFRETRNIFAATFVVLLCSTMFLGGYTLSPPDIRSFLRSVVMLVTSTAFLVCIFIPKLAVLLKRSVNLEEEKKKITDNVRKFSSKSPPSSVSGSVITAPSIATLTMS